MNKRGKRKKPPNLRTSPFHAVRAGPKSSSAPVSVPRAPISAKMGSGGARESGKAEGRGGKDLDPRGKKTVRFLDCSNFFQRVSGSECASWAEKRGQRGKATARRVKKRKLE